MLGGPFMSAYAASKHAVEALTSSLRVELRGWGIQVSIHICQGAEPCPVTHACDTVTGSTLMQRTSTTSAACLFHPLTRAPSRAFSQVVGANPAFSTVRPTVS